MRDDRDAGDVIDVISIIDNGNENGQVNGNDIGNGTDKNARLMAIGNLTSRLQEIRNIPENNISIEDLIMSMANSGNGKQIKLAFDLIDLNIVQGNTLENIGPDCFDKISACNDNLSNNDGKDKINDNEAKETDMEWTTVKPKQKRTRSGSNDSDRTRLETSVSPNKKHK